MTERGAGQRSWPLSAYQVNVSYGKPGAAGDGADWFGPLTPITPLAPPEIAGRQWDFPSGYNLSTLPRVYEPVTFATLRALADGYDLLRLVIETRKDQVARLDWTLAARDKKAAPDPRLAAIKAFFARPDGRHTFADWLRLLLEELFVIDAPALYKSRDRAGRLTALLPIDGATIKPVIDDWGRTPQPYVENGRTICPVAYQQILKGYPAVDYSLRDLLYRPRNIRVNHAYGFGPVEQIITSVNIALRRQAFVLDYFTQGNIPDSLIGVPETWTPDQIAAYQKYWDTYFDGDLARRRRAKFVPGGVAKTFVQTKEPDLKTPFDEWLARLVCFAFSVTPQGLVQQMNRATAQTQKETSHEEGLAPILAWVKGLIDDILAEDFAAPDLEFVWNADAAIDPQAQETILTSYATKGILTINEVRAALGREPLAEPAADKAMTLTGTGYVALGEAGKTVGSVKGDGAVEKMMSFDHLKHPRWPAAAPESQGGRFRSNRDSSSPVVSISDRPDRTQRPHIPPPGVPVVLPNGSKVRDDKSSTGYMMSPVADLSPVAETGRKIGENYRAMLNSPEGGKGAFFYLALELHQYLHQGGTFDYQRETNPHGGYTQLTEFRHVSNFNVGLLCQQAGLSLDETLRIAGGYARLFSSNAHPGKPYGLADKTRQFTIAGYEAGESGVFDSAVKAHE